MSEMEVNIKIQFSEPVRDPRRVVQSVYDALLDQMMSAGFVEMNEEAFTEQITVESGDVRHVWEGDAIPAASIKPLWAMLRGLTQTRAGDPDTEQSRQAIDAVLEVLAAGGASRADVVAICLVLLESVAGIKDEPNFNLALHKYALSRLCDVAGPSGTVSSVLE
jgi:hypothetical protein